MDKVCLQKDSSSAIRHIDVLKLIAARVNSRWKSNADLITENEQQPKRQKKDHVFTSQQENGKDSKVEIFPRKADDTDDNNKEKTEPQSELERVLQRCEELERENMMLRVRLVENGKTSSYEAQVSKLEAEKEKFLENIKGLNRLVERHEKQNKSHNQLRINYEKNLKGKQEVIEDLRRQLIEMSGFAATKERSAHEKENFRLKNENLQLRNEVRMTKAKFEEIQAEFENKLEKKNNEIVEMMVQWIENHELLSTTQDENGKLKSENECSKREIIKLTRELTAKQIEYDCQSDSLKKLETDRKAKTMDINSLNKKLEELTIKHNQKLKTVENEANQLEKCVQQMKVALQSRKNENEEMTKKLAEVEFNLKGKQEEIELLVSDRDEVINFAENVKKITRFPDNDNFPLLNQLEELTIHVKESVRLMDWYVASFKVNSSATGTCKLLLRQHT